jgi:hypothetical protein
MIEVISLEKKLFRARQRAEVGVSLARLGTAREPLAKTEDGFLMVPGRALSAHLVAGNIIDFSKPGVLEASAPKLLGVKLYKDHVVKIDNLCGQVSESMWDSAGAQSDGVPGINVKLAVDVESDPKVGRQIENGLIDSLSVSVYFSAEPSHPEIYDEDPWMFFDLLGHELDGRPVCFVATEIFSYDEISLVWAGADSLAKLFSKTVLGLGERPRAEEVKLKLNKDQSFLAICKALGYAETAEPEVVLSRIEELLEEKRAVDDFENQIIETFQLGECPEVGVTFTRLLAKFDALQVEADFGRARLSECREQVARDMQIALCEPGVELDPALRSQAMSASADDLPGLMKFWGAKASAKFPEGGRSSVPQSNNPTPKASSVADTIH